MYTECDFQWEKYSVLWEGKIVHYAHVHYGNDSILLRLNMLRHVPSVQLCSENIQQMDTTELKSISDTTKLNFTTKYSSLQCQIEIANYSRSICC